MFMNRPCQVTRKLNSPCQVAGKMNSLCQVAGKLNSPCQVAGKMNSTSQVAGKMNGTCQIAGSMRSSILVGREKAVKQNKTKLKFKAKQQALIHGRQETLSFNHLLTWSDFYESCHTGSCNSQYIWTSYLNLQKLLISS